MKRIFILVIVSCLLLSFCYSKSENKKNLFELAFLKEIYINKGEQENNKGEKETRNFIGIFPKSNDTIKIYKFNNEERENLELFSFWSNKKGNNSIIFFCSGNEIKVIFENQNKIIIDNDIYTVNNEYYSFLKQKILEENSILDLVFFVKDGYGDYSELLEPLNKNWRNQKENNSHKIISANIKNKNYQTDDQYFNYKFIYKYDENGVLKSIDGENRYNKKLINDKGKYIQYSISNGENERSFTSQNLFKNKRTLFDSITGNTEQYSISKTTYYTTYQSELKTIVINKKPKSIDEIIKILDVKYPN